MPDLTSRMPRPRIGLLPLGHSYYWNQFPRLREMGLRMGAKLRERLEAIGEVIAPELVDTPEKSAAAGELFRREGIDLLIVFPFGYAPGMNLVPAVLGTDGRDARRTGTGLDCPVRLLNAHEDSSYDYAAADTTDYLHHEGVCCIPEFAGALVTLGKRFRVITGHFGEDRLWEEIRADGQGAAAARAFRELRFGVIGETYTGMTDMPIDEHRLLRATGRLLVRPEVEEIAEAFRRVTDEQLQDMYRQFREMYEVDPTVTDEHMRLSAQIAVAFDEVVRRHDLSAFGYYWWGEKEEITQLRAQSALAVSRLAALGRPGVTEGDVKTAMAMKLLDLLGAGGMFAEFFAMDFDENFLLLGHDGPSNINMAEDRPRLQHLAVHHGKSGHGLGIDFTMRPGPVTLLGLTQFGVGNRGRWIVARGTPGGEGEGFKLICAVGEVIPGPVLTIGNPNCRVRVARPIPEFMEAWCQQGPAHHLALGLGDRRRELGVYAETMGWEFAEV